MNREHFQRLALARIEDAKALFDASRFDAAYYLAGYAVECAFKACICKRTREFDFPPKDSAKYYTHDLEVLATLVQELGEERKSDPILETYWGTVKDWSEAKRYEFFSKPDEKAKGLIQAVSDPDHGVLRCLSKYW